MNRKLSTTAVVALIASAALVGCGGSDSSSSTSSKSGSTSPTLEKVVGGSVTFVTAPATVEALNKAGVQINTGSGGVKKGASVVLVFRNGKMVTTGLIGRARSHGSIVFTHGAKKVTFADVMVDTAHRRVTGVESGKRVTLYRLRIKELQRTRLKDGSFSGTGLSVRLATDAAKRLNSGLGVKVFEPKMKFGTVAVVVKFEKASKSSKSSNK